MSCEKIVDEVLIDRIRIALLLLDSQVFYIARIDV